MTSSGDFNVSVVGALVLGGIAALLLATAIALGGYGRARDRAPLVSTSKTVPSASAAGSAVPDAEIEYLLDTSEPTSSPPRAP